MATLQLSVYFLISVRKRILGRLFLRSRKACWYKVFIEQNSTRMKEDRKQRVNSYSEHSAATEVGIFEAATEAFKTI